MRKLLLSYLTRHERAFSFIKNDTPPGCDNANINYVLLYDQYPSQISIISSLPKTISKILPDKKRFRHQKDFKIIMIFSQKG